MSKILLIEDERKLSDILTMKLQESKFEVLRAYDGEEGLDKALKNHPDIILLDIVMPVMDGITMFKKLRQDDWGKQVPVIVLTNLNCSTINDKEVEKLISCCLVKTDWKLDDIIKKINETLNL